MKHIEIETIEIAGFASALNALRLPFGKESRSLIDTECIVNDDCGHKMIDCKSSVAIDPKDITLLNTLVRRGDEHAKVVRGIIVYAKISAPVYWWCEAETYRAGHERLASNSTMHQDCRGLSGDELVKAKEEIPMGKVLTKVDFFSYQCLRNIVKQRTGHRLPHWAEFIEWIHTLPLADELIFAGLEKEE